MNSCIALFVSIRPVPPVGVVTSTMSTYPISTWDKSQIKKSRYQEVTKTLLFVLRRCKNISNSTYISCGIYSVSATCCKNFVASIMMYKTMIYFWHETVKTNYPGTWKLQQPAYMSLHVFILWKSIFCMTIPDSNVGFPNVGPTLVLYPSRWPKAEPIRISVWDCVSVGVIVQVRR